MNVKFVRIKSNAMILLFFSKILSSFFLSFSFFSVVNGNRKTQTSDGTQFADKNEGEGKKETQREERSCAKKKESF